MANAKFILGQTGGQIDVSTAAAPATPAAGYVTLYADTDKSLYSINEDGVVTPLGTGVTGPQGPTGATGAAGATGPAGSNATSPITVEQTNSLVSTAIGATAGSGANCAVVIGNNACANAGASNSIVIGTGSCHYAYGSDSVLIGKSVRSSNISTIGIGEGVISETQRGLAIGYIATTCCNNAGGAMAIGCGTVANGDSNCAGIAIGIGAKAFRDGIHLGIGGFSCASQSTVVGVSSRSFPGATGTIVLGASSVGGTGAADSVVLGNSSCSTATNTIAIGSTAKTICQDNIAIGNTSCSCICEGIVIGKNAFAPKPVNGDIGSAIVIGQVACVKTGGSFGGAVVIGNAACGFSYNSVNIGPGTQTGGESAIAIGTIPSASADFAIAIGRQTSASGTDSIAMGRTTCATAACTIAIGNSAKSICLDTIAIGQNSCSNICEGIVIGKNAFARKPTFSDVFSAIVIGQNACTTADGYGGAIVIGSGACAGAYVGTAIGYNAKGLSEASIAIGQQTTTNGFGSIALGDRAVLASVAGIAIGSQSYTTGTCGIAIGKSACSIHTCAVVLGPNITSERDNTVHLNSLIAYGQAASKAHAVGSTGGTATLNWDNSNVQFVTLTSSVTSLTKSNPIDGAVYTVFVTQGGSGGYTVNWGSDVKWAGGTGPTLSTAIGATDAVSLVYYAGITGYYGNANLNFA